MHILLLDLSNLLARNQYVFPEAKNHEGILTGGLYGSINSTRSFLTKRPHQAVIAACDWGVPAFRKELAPEYKEQRETGKTPAQLALRKAYKAQAKVAYQLLKPFGVTTARAQGFEADDCIPALIKRMPEHSFTILSTDGDYVQLVDPSGRVNLYDPNINDYRSSDEHYCLKRCLDPKASDNLDGPSGVGKVAAELVVSSWIADGCLPPTDPDYVKTFLAWATKRAETLDKVGKACNKVIADQQLVRRNWKITWLANTSDDCNAAMKFRRATPDSQAAKDACDYFNLRPFLEDWKSTWPPFSNLACPV